MANTKFSFKKKNELILVLVLFASLLLANAIKVKESSDENSLNNVSVIEQCANTLYPQLCYSTISSIVESSKLLSVKDIVELSLSVAIDAAKYNHKNIKKLAMSLNHLTRRERMALGDCIETTDKTLEDLRKVVEVLREYPQKKSLTLYADDLKTYLSSAMTNQETCLEGFSEDKSGKRVLKFIETSHIQVTKLCSNALALVKNMTDNDLMLSLLASEPTKKTGSSLHDEDSKIVLFSDITNEQGEGENRGREALEDGIKWPEWMSVSDQMLLESSSEVAADTVVAADGSGNFLTVSEAVAAAPKKNSKRYVIRIKKGVYNENVEVPSNKKNIMFWGDGKSKTIITGSRSFGTGWTTFKSATVAAVGDGFLARDITFENTAGPANHQAVALRVGSDLSAFYRCDILAYQDTLYVHSNRQFFVDCVVAGTVDFIFGNSAVVIQNSVLTPRRPGPKQQNMITAQARTELNQNTGIVIQKCTIIATSDLEPVIKEFPSFLGRPWKEYARVVVMQSDISNVIDKKGWAPWSGDFALKTLFFAEYDNKGAGANTSFRVKWSSVIDEAQAEPFTVGPFIGGAEWLPSTGFPYQLGL